MSDSAMLRYIRDCDAPVVGASEMADEFGYATIKGARKRLTALEADGYIASKKLGDVRAYWLTPAGRERVAAES